MRVTTYNTKLNEDRLNILVKEKTVNYQTNNISNPQSVFEMMNTLFDMGNLAEEYMYMIALNTKGKVIGVFEISHGTINASLINPREIFIRALLCGAAGIIIAHNHPSGDTSPSAEDKHATKRIKDAGDLMGIKLLDHVIIGDNYFSFKENDLL